jgi:hypothetical protein
MGLGRVRGGAYFSDKDAVEAARVSRPCRMAAGTACLPGLYAIVTTFCAQSPLPLSFDPLVLRHVQREQS